MTTTVTWLYFFGIFIFIVGVALLLIWVQKIEKRENNAKKIKKIKFIIGPIIYKEKGEK